MPVLDNFDCVFGVVLRDGLRANPHCDAYLDGCGNAFSDRNDVDFGIEFGVLGTGDTVWFGCNDADSAGSDGIAFDDGIDRSGIALSRLDGKRDCTGRGRAAELQFARQWLWGTGIGESV
jgi:hypothetical protein